jgi:DNA-binding CsgD family transcriptional regulator
MPDSAELEEKIVDAVYRGACEPDELVRAIGLIAQHFDSTGVILAEFDQAAPEAALAIGARTVDRSFFVDYAPYAPFDPAPRAFAALPVGTVAPTHRLFSDKFLRKNVFLNEYLRPKGVGAALGGSLLAAGGRFAQVSILAATNRRRFGNDDVERLERLTPHLTRALQIRRLFLQSQSREQVLESVLSRSPTGIIASSSNGALLFVNEALRAMAAARDGLSVDRHGRLVALDRTAARRLNALEADVGNGGAGGLVRIERPSGRPPYMVLVSPLPSTEDILMRTRRAILIAIHDPSRRIPSTAQRVAHLLHLTPGAAKLVAAILEGVDLKDYAERESISMNTVKFHLKTAFDRTETRSQSDLIRRAMLAINDLGPYFPER